MMQILLRACAALALSLNVGTALSADGVTSRQIVVGQTLTLQGGKNEYGSAVLAGVQTALQAVNSKGGVNGREIVLKVLDDNNQPATAEANARQLIQQDRAFVLFGSIEGGPSTAVMKAAVDMGVPFFGPMAGSPTLRRPHQPLVFPVRAEHREEFRALLDYAKKIGHKNVAFMRSDSETGLQHLENVKIICRELGLELVLDMPFKSDITDPQIEALAQALTTSKAQVVINHGGTGVYERLIRKARQTGGARTAFYGVNSGSAQLAKRLGELAQGMIFAQVVPSPWERKTGITREYQEDFARQKPGQDFSYGSLEGYLTAKALVAALRAAGPNPTRESFLAGLANARLDLNGMVAVYSAGAHTGAKLVDLAIISREGRFLH